MTPDEVDHRAGCMNKDVFPTEAMALRVIDNMVWAGEIDKGFRLNVFRCTRHPGMRVAFHVGSTVAASRLLGRKEKRIKRRKRRH